MEDLLNYFKEHREEEEITVEEKLELIEKNDLEINNLLEKSLKFNDVLDKVIYNESLFQDLEIFQDHLQNEKFSILNKIDRTKTALGNYYLKNKLKSPTFNLEELTIQKNNISKMVNLNIDEPLELIYKNEKQILWFWKEIDENLQSIHDMIYFNSSYLSFFNYNEMYLLIMNIYKIFISPVITVVSPLSSIIFLFIMYSYYKIDIPFSEMLNICKKLFFSQFSGNSKLKIFVSVSIWLFFYFQGIYQTINVSKQINKISNLFHNKINTLTKFVKITSQIHKNILETKLEFKYLNILENLDKLIPSLNNKLFDSEPSLFNNKGKIFSTYYTILNIKEQFEPLLLFISEADYYNSIKELYVEFKKRDNKLCLPEYVDNKDIIFKIRECWHPYLQKNPVKNSIDLNKNVIITGPNAAGKSTFIKTLLLNTLLSQTISLSSSSYFKLSLFENFNSYLHIPDTKGKESLFEAEMNRSLDYISFLENNRTKKSLIIMDEIFSSTNNVEGVEAAKIVCNKLSKFKNNMTLLTTHYSELSELEKKTKKFINYKFKITRDKKKNIIFTYKLIKGVSKDKIALELFSKKINE